MGHLILARHGNTFEADQKVVWVGARNDLPLAKKGMEQAEELADALLRHGIAISAVHCGPLKRTRDYAEIIRKKLKSNFEQAIDERLNELDYGSWSGLSDQEVILKFGQEMFDAWNKLGVWPADSDWGDSQETIIEQIRNFVQTVIEDLGSERNVLAITSNGRLKYFLKLIPGAFDQAAQKQTLKVGTGKVSVFHFDKMSGKFTCLAWNEIPAIAFKVMAKLSPPEPPSHK